MSNGFSDSEAERDIESRLQDADAAIESLAEDYEVWAGEDLNVAKQALESARSLPTGRQPQIQKVFNVVHDMKGQGGTFGYDLITLISQSLCDFIRNIPDATDAELKVIDHHLAAMAIVLDNRIKGSGGKFAGKIRAKLERIITAAQG